MNCIVPACEPSCSDGDMRQRVHLAWLIKLRWGAAFGQVVAAVVFWFIPVALPLRAMWAIVAATSLSNCVLHLRASRAAPLAECWIASVVTLDVLLLTAMLYCSGGATNPFSFLYLIHMALAAVILRPKWVAVEVTLSSLCFVWLSYVHVPLPLPPEMHQWGLMAAYTFAAVNIVYFVQRVHSVLRTKQALLSAAAARSERLTSLATLAAGAAHELSTPLATIAVVAKELEHRIAALDRSGQGTQRNEAAIEDAQLIRHEVERCRTVLSHMAADAGTTSGEPFIDIQVGELIEASLVGLAQRDRVRLLADTDALSKSVRVPHRSVAQAVRGIAKNAFDASSGAAWVRLHVRCDAGELHLAVEDRGHGMAPEVLARAGEPFFTTKDPGRGPSGGMGLGLFLARTLFEHIGGSLQVTSIVNQGTRVDMTLPINAAS